MTILWRGLMQNPLTGYQSGDGWSNIEAPHPERQAVVQPDGMLRLEVKFGDEYQNPITGQWYTEERALLTAVNQTTFTEGQEHWLYWTTLYPADGKDWFPKQDQLADWPKIGLDGGSCVEIHQQPAPGPPYFGDWSKMPGGSAPIYTGVANGRHYLSLTDQATSTPLQAFTLPLERGRKNLHVMHAKWSADAKKGFLHYWINAAPCVYANDAPDKPLVCATMYPGCTNYLVAGIYRRRSVGDPNLTWPMDAAPGVTYPPAFVPKKGQPIYPAGDGEPGVQYLGTVTLADSQSDVPNQGAPVATTPTAQPQPAVPANFDSTKPSVNPNAGAALLMSTRDALVTQVAALQAQVDAINALLSKGPYKP